MSLKPFLIEFDSYSSTNGTLAVYESGKGVPFKMSRVFSVSAGVNQLRGKHAHKNCTQILICITGAIEVECDDGKIKQNFKLERSDLGLVIPPAIWATQKYLKEGSVLLALCDMKFDELDYIRSYDKFIKFTSNMKSN